MADEPEFKIKGAAARASESSESAENTSAAGVEPDLACALEEGEVVQSVNKEATPEQSSKNPTDARDLERYRWCKCMCDPAQYPGHSHYFLHLDGQETVWEEPSEPYWVWNTDKQALDECGLQQPTSQQSAVPTTATEEEYTGYNPKIHGSYDPNAPYAQYHNRKRQEEALIDQGYPPGTDPASIATTSAAANYASIGTFNRFTGNYQAADKSTDRHTDAAKSGRQMNAYFDVDRAANMHDGRSLKEERRNERLSKKQIKEMQEKRKEKKLKKRMDFYKS